VTYPQVDPQPNFPAIETETLKTTPLLHRLSNTPQPAMRLTNLFFMMGRRLQTAFRIMGTC